MTFKIKNVLLLIFCATIIFSCKDDDTEPSTITEVEKFTFTTLPEAITVPEEAATFPLDFTFDEKQIIDVHVVVSVDEESTATEDADFHLSSHAVDVAAVVGEGGLSITVDEDFLPEPTETVILTFAGDEPFGLPETQTTLVMNIENKIYPPAIQLNWDNSFLFSGNTFNTCGNTDMDLLIFDDMGNEVSGFAGATGACPELVFADDITADGTYDLVANLFGDGSISGLVISGAIDSFEIDLQLTLFKGGVVAPEMSTSVYSTIDYSIDKFYSYTPSDPDGENLITIGSVTVNGGEMVLFDPDGTEVGRFD